MTHEGRKKKKTKVQSGNKHGGFGCEQRDKTRGPKGRKRERSLLEGREKKEKRVKVEKRRSRYRRECASDRRGRRGAGRRSCRRGIWRASRRCAVWCVAAGFPSGWMRRRTGCTGMACHLREEGSPSQNYKHTRHFKGVITQPIFFSFFFFTSFVFLLNCCTVLNLLLELWNFAKLYRSKPTIFKQNFKFPFLDFYL